MDLHMQKIKKTDYALVFTGPILLGIIDKGTYINREDFTEAHKKAAGIKHAETFKERIGVK